ncbi:FAD/NAD(P)-binding domain-containing protein [Aulographum hederae CBS 113979]|uniref:FAD/NAD(P)-binding domain-containing protein n=1 Tax=Aulographum hederae CBS 113979 TaxID=1176131 RepID=A0A6G1GY41_9PEZI|nr:FAD/NAD(P)-binding domain-containing protein [Aulographum hederae CBS 113979]
MAPSAINNSSPSNVTFPTTSPQEDDSYDVIVVGGGWAGIGAAIGAKQAAPHSRVLIIESEACLGGASTHRGVLALCGLYTCDGTQRKVVGGVWDELRPKLEERGAVSRKPISHRGTFLVVEPEGLKIALDELVAEYNISVLLHTPVVGATRENNLITSVEIQERRGRRHIAAKAFIDCSGDCDLAFVAGASTRYGNHGAVNLGSLSTRFAGFAPDAEPTAPLWREAIEKAKAANPALKKIIPKDASVLLRLPLSGDAVTYLASASYDARSSADITRAEQQGRIQAQEYLKILRTLPGHQDMYLVSSGPNFGTRESRHLSARHTLTSADMLSSRRYADCIALGGWGQEWHSSLSPTFASEFSPCSEGSFDIPLACLWSVDTGNLLAAGRCLDGDKGAGSAVRVLGTALATGQAAGVAGGLFAREGREVGGKEVRGVLRREGAVLDAGSLVA